MAQKNKNRRMMSDQHLMNEAIRYTSRSAMKIGSPSEYREILRRKIDQIGFAHMTVANRHISLEMCHNLAAMHNGDFLSTEIKSKKDKYTWKCHKGHVFERSFESIQLSGGFCTPCSYEQRHAKQRKSIQDVRSLANERGGILLSKKYKNNAEKLRWRCKFGHDFDMTWANAKKGSWCPQCFQYSGSYSERIVRYVFERLTGHTFHKFTSDWLKNSRGNWMEIDGVNEELGIGFEHHGTQHYRPTKFYDEEALKLRKRDDADKISLSAENGITILEIRELYKETSLTQLIKQVRGFLELKSIPSVCSDKEVINDINSIYKINPMKEVKEIAESLGLKLISNSYQGNKFEYTFYCQKHRLEFKKRLSYLKRGSACPKCSERQVLDIDRIATFATSNGAKLIEPVIVNGVEKYRFRCRKNDSHEWITTKESIRNSGCPTCGVEKVADAKRNSMEAYRTFVEPRGFRLLNKKIHTSNEKLELACTNCNLSFKISFWNFKKRERCSKCGWSKNPAKNNSNTENLKNFKKKIAANNFSLCESEVKYRGLNSEYRVRCSNKCPGFSAKGKYLIQRTTCETCKGWNPDKLRELAKSKGGKFLSTEYGGYLKTHRWQCEKGHSFEKNIASIVRGRWCTECAKNHTRLQKTKPFSEVRKDALAIGYELPPQTYVNGSQPLVFKCKNGCYFTMLMHNLKKRRKCTVCKNVTKT